MSYRSVPVVSASAKYSRFFLFCLLCAAYPVLAQKGEGYNKVAIPLAPLAGCMRATAQTELSLNNVSSVYSTGGTMAFDYLKGGGAAYEVPKGSKKTALEAGSLWIGGTDINNQVRVAALLHRSRGDDYWPGPLTIDNTAEVSRLTCEQYDKFFRINRLEVEEFNAWYDKPSDYPNYNIPRSILEWPAHGDPLLNQEYNLAPFFDRDGDGIYNPQNGDYPYYDIYNKRVCSTTGDCKYGQPLYGDETLWWVFNDKGNLHSESKSEAIGMEVRAQAFAFSTNDEINNMTFCNFQIINRSTYTLANTYFGFWADSDLGCPNDDFVGCDVNRGLGYCYNGDAFDEDCSGYHGYLNLPSAIGVDFFEGPFMDPDGLDNPKIKNNDPSINGLNFGDGIPDNERWGMRRFVYHNRADHPNWAINDPLTGTDFYNYLRGIWKDGSRMIYGGNAHVADATAYGPECDFMFPGDSDPTNWGTGGVPPNGPKYWTEQTVGNTPFDRRFVQSAGPFTLMPGACNYVTVGIVWAQANGGGPFASVELLRRVDDKAQALFENCFRILNGPDAPELTVRELEQEIILTISNKTTSNNYNESYEEFDPMIVSPDSLLPGNRWDSTYNFQGYQIFQLRDPSVSLSTSFDAQEKGYDQNKVRLIAQCDVKDGVAKLVNFYKDVEHDLSYPVLEVEGADKGISHSFRITADAFSSGEKKLVNYKTYYFTVIAYASNNYKYYNPNDFTSLDGQTKTYLPGRRNIKTYTAVPHKPQPQNGGQYLNSFYGCSPQITRIEGAGNGGLILDFTQKTVDEILASSSLFPTPEYEPGRGPLNVRVYDPVAVPLANFVFKMDGTTTSAGWMLVNETTHDTTRSVASIAVAHEQLIPQWGLSITVTQPPNPGQNPLEGNGLLESDLSFSEPDNAWLDGYADQDGITWADWIKSGSWDNIINDTLDDYDTSAFIDPSQYYEHVINGTWAPYRLCAADSVKCFPALARDISSNLLSDLHSVDVVITPDRTKWTRCVVLETGTGNTENNALRLHPRKHASVDKYGFTGDGIVTNDPADADYIATSGMGWFPGYALNLESGERLNVMFGEDSRYPLHYGRDMLWNPSNVAFDTISSEYVLGGRHYIYVMGHHSNAPGNVPAYDYGRYIDSVLSDNTADHANQVFKDVMWVNIPLLKQNKNFLSCEAKVRIRVQSPYAAFNTSASPLNNNNPMYRFSTSDLANRTNDPLAAKSALDLIRIVPNPYYSYSGYESSQLENRVKITNLPSRCTISIYSVNGILIRRYHRDTGAETSTGSILDQVNLDTSQDWDLKNEKGVPIASGLYLIHIEASGIGEKVIKWFGTIRPLDFNNF